MFVYSVIGFPIGGGWATFHREYKRRKNAEKQQKKLDSEIALFSKEKENREELNPKELQQTMKELLKFDTINEENKSLVFKLIDKIIIDDDIINIKYKFNNLEL